MTSVPSTGDASEVSSACATFSPSAFDPGSDPFDASVGPAVSPAVDEPVDYPVEPDVDVYSNDYHSRGKTHNQQMWL